MKLGRAIFLFAFVAAFSVFADTAILVALPSEQDVLRKEVRIVGQPVELASHRISIGYRKGEKIYIVRTGAGIINAAMTTQALLTRYKIDRVISIGVAGNLNDGWKVGDVMIATEVVNHQQGKETPGGFEVKKESEPSPRDATEAFPSQHRSQNPEAYGQKCEQLRSNAVEVAKLATDAHGSNTNAVATPRDGVAENLSISAVAAHGSGVSSNSALREGRLVSGDSFIASSAKRKWLRETFHADAVDMVSAGIARVCEANGVPYVIIRVLSDNADESASADFTAFIQKHDQPVTAEIVIGLIDKLAKPADNTVRQEPHPPR